jgi:poly-gamma-glutamate capsule biosynthesis protein CapA/YwtB (metallophosphatase superfamily)
VAVPSNRDFLNTLLAIGVFSPFLLIGADGTHHLCARLMAARLQSDLARIESEYSSRLIEARELSMLFVGDIMLSRSVGRIMERNADYRHPFLESAAALREADLTFGNLEGPISNRGTNQGSEYSLRADPKVIEGLNFAGFDVLAIANNHIWDWGSDALVDTATLLQENNIEAVGAGSDYVAANKPIIKKIDGLSVAFLAYTDRYPNSLRATEQAPGISSFDVQNIQGLISELKKEVDIIVISLHWGEEYAGEPSASQRNVAHSLINAGASLIIGHHPHVVQEVEAYKDGWIAYSLGNFVFDQNFSPQTMEGLAIRARIKNKNIVGIDKLPVYLSDSFQPTFSKL